MNFGLRKLADQKIAYIISRFPVLTETFITNEVEEIRRKGVDIEVFSLRGPNLKESFQKNTAELIKTTHYYPFFFSLEIWAGLFFYLKTRPVNCLKILTKIFKTHVQNPVALLKILAVMPKTFAIAKKLKDMGITRIHAHWATIPATVAFVVSELNGCDFTFTAHAWDIFKVDIMLEEKILKSKKVITCTNYNKEYLLQKFPHIDGNKITVIHHGLDFDSFNPAQKKRDGEFKILSIGRLTEKKGIHYLLKACSLLREKGIPFHTQIIYVDGDYEKFIFRLYENLHLEDCVEFIPGMPQEKLVEYYSNADCFVLPCLVANNGERDGIPNVILEAMAMELPVVTTPISGIPEVIKAGETGILVEPENADELAAAIQQLYYDTKLRDFLGNSGRGYIQEQFGISSTIDCLLKNIL